MRSKSRSMVKKADELRVKLRSEAANCYQNQPTDGSKSKHNSLRLLDVPRDNSIPLSGLSPERPSLEYSAVNQTRVKKAITNEHFVIFGDHWPLHSHHHREKRCIDTVTC